MNCYYILTALGGRWNLKHKGQSELLVVGKVIHWFSFSVTMVLSMCRHNWIAVISENIALELDIGVTSPFPGQSIFCCGTLISVSFKILPVSVKTKLQQSFSGGQRGDEGTDKPGG